MIKLSAVTAILILFSTLPIRATEADSGVITPVTVFGTLDIEGGNIAEQLPADQVIRDLVKAAIGIDAEDPEEIELSPTVIFVTKGAKPSGSFQDTLLSEAQNSNGWIVFSKAGDADGGTGHVAKALDPLANDIELAILGSCSSTDFGAPQPTAEEFTKALDADGDKAIVVVVCITDDTKETAIFNELLTVLKDGGEYLALHTVSYVGVDIAAYKRSLQQSNSSSTDPNYCDGDCQKDVIKLEGLIVFVLLGFALLVGFFCMHRINTPTKFAKVKDTRQHQD